MVLPRRFGQDPGPQLPRRVMPDMLGMAAIEISNPVSFVVLMETDNRPYHPPHSFMFLNSRVPSARSITR
jgi:hypothetical protein